MFSSDETKYNPDLMAKHMKIAADDRGIPNSFSNFPVKSSHSLYRTWLSLEIYGKCYYYSYGALLEAGAGRWGEIGRNINHKAMLLTADKFNTKIFLNNRGFNVPKGKFFRRRHIDEAIKAYDLFVKPVCVKPNRGSEGNRVFPNINDRSWYKHAILQVAEQKPNILIEESVSGGHYRFFYIEPNVVAIRQGQPLHIIGNGVSTVAELLESKNNERRKRKLPTHSPFQLDQRALDFLAMQNLTKDSILQAGQITYLRGTSNATAGADTFLIDKNEIHPSYLSLVERACKNIPGLHISGVDLIIEDIYTAATDENHWVLELNTRPAITSYYYPWQGKNY